MKSGPNNLASGNIVDRRYFPKQTGAAAAWQTQIGFIIIFILVLFIPFQTLLSKILTSHTGLSQGMVFWLCHWYEPVILIIVGLLTIRRFWQKRRVPMAGITSILALIALSIVSVMLFSPSIGRGIEGFRFTLFALLPLSAVLFLGLEPSQKRTILNLYAVLGLIVALWALAEPWLPLNYWQQWHILAAGSEFGYGQFTVVFLPQLASLIGAPNQLATYLLPAFFIYLDRAGQPDQANWRRLLAAGLIGLAIVGTMSRSAWLGLSLGLLFYLFIVSKNLLIKLGTVAVIIVAAVLAYRLYLGESSALRDVVTHGASDQQHSNALNLSLDEIKSRQGQWAALFFGSGLGTAGPIVLKYGDGYVSESWYLQLLLELGVVGLSFWLMFLFSMVGELVARKNYALLSALIGVSVAALFLHTWADNPAMSISLLIILGLGLVDQKAVNPKYQTPINK